MRAHVGSLISHGTPLYAITRQRGLPNIATLRRWLVEDTDLRKTYEEARDLREEYSADDAVMLADALADTNSTGLRLRLDARKWSARLNRKDRKDGTSTAKEKQERVETLERLQRALERVRKREEEEASRRPVPSEEKPDDGAAA